MTNMTLIDGFIEKLDEFLKDTGWSRSGKVTANQEGTDINISFEMMNADAASGSQQKLSI